MCGSSLFEYVHQQDHVELAEHLGLSLPGATTMPSPGSASDEGSSTSTANTPRALTPPLPAERERRTFADYQGKTQSWNFFFSINVFFLKKIFWGEGWEVTKTNQIHIWQIIKVKLNEVFKKKLIWGGGAESNKKIHISHIRK